MVTPGERLRKGTIRRRGSFDGAMQTARVIQNVVDATADYLATVLLILGVGLVYYFIPNAKTRFRDVWVGAALTGILWRIAFDGFSWYISRNTSMTMIHGSIAAVVVFLFWVFVSAIILMYGVEFTAAYARLRRRRPDDMPAAATPRV